MSGVGDRCWTLNQKKKKKKEPMGLFVRISTQKDKTKERKMAANVLKWCGESERLRRALQQQECLQQQQQHK